MKEKNFSEPRKFLIGPCPERGRAYFCDGCEKGDPKGVPDLFCPASYAFHSVLYLNNAHVECSEPADSCSADGNCPEYIEWSLDWKGQKEYIGVTNGEILSGYGPSGVGPCAFTEMKATNPGILDTIGELYDLVPEGNEPITKHLQENLGALEDIWGQVQVYYTSRSTAEAKVGGS